MYRACMSYEIICKIWCKSVENTFIALCLVDNTGRSEAGRHDRHVLWHAQLHSSRDVTWRGLWYAGHSPGGAA